MWLWSSPTTPTYRLRRIDKRADNPVELSITLLGRVDMSKIVAKKYLEVVNSRIEEHNYGRKRLLGNVALLIAMTKQYHNIVSDLMEAKKRWDPHVLMSEFVVDGKLNSNAECSEKEALAAIAFSMFSELEACRHTICEITGDGYDYEDNLEGSQSSDD